MMSATLVCVAAEADQEKVIATAKTAIAVIIRHFQMLTADRIAGESLPNGCKKSPTATYRSGGTPTSRAATHGSLNSVQ
jgi:hypothetical protein